MTSVTSGFQIKKTFLVKTYSRNPKHRTEVSFETGEEGRVVMKNETGRMVWFGTVSDLCQIAKGKPRKSYFEFNTIKLWANDFSRMVKSVCNWYKQFKSHSKEQGKNIAPRYVRHPRTAKSFNQQYCY